MSTTNTRHKHADVIIAFAEGKKIQFRYDNSEWQDWYGIGTPSFHIDYDWRIKPAEPVVRWLWAYQPADAEKSDWFLSHYLSDREVAEFFRSDTKRQKLEFSRTEFPVEGE